MNQSDREILSALYDVAARFRRIDPEMPLQTLQTFLLAASRDHLPMSEISDALSISGSAVSRNVAAFSHNKGRGEPGHRLLVSTEDPLDRRRRIVRNTPASRKLAQEVVDILRSAFDRAAAPMPPRSMGDSRGANPGAI